MSNRKQRRAQAAQQRRKVTLKKGKFDPRTYSNGDSDRVEANINYMQYVSSRGTKVMIYPMPAMLQEKIELGLEAEWERPLPPTYEIKTASSAVETHEHTEDTLRTDEEKATWAVYQEDLSDWNEEAGRRFMRALQLECIKPADDDEAWIEKQAFMGLAVPENKYERHLHWVETEVIGDQEDIISIMVLPMKLMGAPEEEIEAAERLFRDSIQEEALSKRTAKG